VVARVTTLNRWVPDDRPPASTAIVTEENNTRTALYTLWLDEYDIEMG